LKPGRRYGKIKTGDLSEKHESESLAAACTPTTGADFFAGELAYRRKNRFLADFAPGNLKDLSKI
jgi:hypothetical protein